jgi:hypothetical protein
MSKVRVQWQKLENNFNYGVKFHFLQTIHIQIVRFDQESAFLAKCTISSFWTICM